jgi:uncharacterized protein (TIGR03435 family)
VKNTFKVLVIVVGVVCSVAIGIAQGRAKFEVVSIRPYVDPGPRAGERNGGPGGGGGAPAGRGAAAQIPCPWRGTIVTPARLAAPRITTLSLISWAYGQTCSPALGLISGQPAWTTTELYDFQATMPAGTPAYGFTQLQDGKAPKLQEMLQTMLEDRFKLKFHREKKEVNAYDVVVAKPGKMTPSKDQTPPPEPYGESGALINVAFGPDGYPPPGLMIMTGTAYRGKSIAVSTFAQGLGTRDGRVGVDKTGHTGFFDIDVPVIPDPAATPGRGQPPAPGGGMPVAISDQIIGGLGLKLVESKTTIDVLVIDHIEKPTEN